VIRTFVRGFGQTLITFGLVVLLFAGYEVYGKGFEVAAAQNKLEGGLDSAWADKQRQEAVKAEVRPPLGAGMSRLYIPRLNKEWVVVEGVRPQDIKHAPGHYPKSAMPGQEGNFAIAGHRMPSVWWDLDLVRNGDALIVETKTDWIVYKVYKIQIVLPTAVGVVAPNPDRPGAAPTRKIITLTTCNPKWDNYERLVVHGELNRDLPKSMGEPAELAGMKG
jgi:LPXTG-site transpeptidase (sortase) family protein